jgi:hypothetical protein
VNGMAARYRSPMDEGSVPLPVGRFRPRGSNPSARTSKPLKSFIAVRGIRTRADSRARQRWASQIVVLFCSTRGIGSVPVGLQSTPSADDRFLALYVRSQGGS